LVGEIVGENIESIMRKMEQKLLDDMPSLGMLLIRLSITSFFRFFLSHQ
jgi:hypothetical protein